MTFISLIQLFLPGVNLETKEIDGSVRFYCNFSVKNTENEKTVTLPIYIIL